MDRIRGIYERIFDLISMFIVAASFICISLLGYCTEEWLPRNVAIGCVAIGCVAEVILFICGINAIRKGPFKILRECYSVWPLKEKKLYVPIKEFYVRIRFLMGFEVALSFIMLFFPYGLIFPDGECFTPILIYALNVMVPAWIFFIWMGIEIGKINKQME